MIRKIKATDKDIYITLSEEFYHGDGVSHAIPREYIQNAFDEFVSGTPFAEAYLIEYEGIPCGYGQLSFTYSTEAGGKVVWIEELYIRAQYQGKGLGSEFLHFVLESFKGNACRIRLEINPQNSSARRLYQKFGFTDMPYTSMLVEYDKK